MKQEEKNETYGYAVGVQMFDWIRKRNAPYIDKTQYVWKMASTKAKYFHLEMRRIVRLLILTALLFSSCATLQERAEQKEQMKKAVAEAVATKQMHIDIASMNTMRYGSRTVTPDFYLELNGDSVRSYLPYFGQAYQAPMMSPSQGLNFETRAKSIRVTQPKRSVSRIEMDLKTDEDTFLYVIELYDTGKAYILVRSQHRDPISFDGELLCELNYHSDHENKFF